MTEEEFTSEMRGRYEEGADYVIDGAIQRKAKQKIEDRKREEREGDVAVIYLRSLPMGSLILESIKLNGITPVFLGYNNQAPDEQRKIYPYFQIENTRYKPVTDYPYQPCVFSIEEIKLLNGLSGPIPPIISYFDDIAKFHDEFVVADTNVKTLGNTFIQETYQQHKFNAVSYPFGMGPPGTGKTHFGELISELSYRGMLCSGINSANIYDYIGDRVGGTCTIIDDEAHELARAVDPEGR